MATDVRVISRATERVEELGLMPLNNILVNVLLNPEAFERNRAEGADLVPVQCGSMTAAAYLFEPSITLMPEAGAKDPETIIPDGGAEQTVAYWRECKDESDLSKHFEPNGVVDAMRPTSPEIDRLGTLARLRIAEVTYKGLRNKLESGTDDLASPATVAAIRAERSRLRDGLLQLREKLAKALSASSPISYRHNGVDVNLSVTTPLDELKQHLGGPKAHEVAGLIEIKLERERLEIVLAKMSS
ncbi:MAG: hypothetical protein E5W81_12275 [Mesorhizobium sp.]|nr:MAG: hypothetical protein E5V36_00555 [Mesorhizobium sp.]TKB82036.1 MAG: hypothetical protein E5W81_12275 [Mesorhizobium sp.]